MTTKEWKSIFGAAEAATRAVAVFVAALLAAACAEEPRPVIRVGEIGVAEARLTGLSDAERAMAADLLGFGAAVAADQLDALLTPIVDRDLDDALIGGIPYHLAARQMGLGDAELRLAYDTSPEWELTVRHVVRLVDAADPAAYRDSALAIARDVAARAARGEDFADLAARFSEEPGAAERGGLLEPGRRGSWVDPFWEAAVALEPGETSGVVESPYGYHVLRLDDRQPVPFDEANVTELLRRIVPRSFAAGAMEAWAPTGGMVRVDSLAAERAHELLRAGEPIPGSLALATGAEGARYTGAELAAGWARLAPDERDVVLNADDAAFAGWILTDARQAIWADLARGMGVMPPESARQTARLTRRANAEAWAMALGFGAGQSIDDLRDAAFQGLRSGAADARSARRALVSFRPLLRESYPVVDVEP